MSSSIFEKVKDCFRSKRSIYIGPTASGPFKVGAFDPSNNMILLTKYKRTELYKAYVQLLGLTKKEHLKDVLYEYVKQTESENPSWDLDFDYSIWVDEKFFRLNSIRFGHHQEDDKLYDQSLRT